MVIGRFIFDVNYVVLQADRRAHNYVYEEYTMFDSLIYEGDRERFYSFIHSDAIGLEEFVYVHIIRRDGGYRPCLICMVDRDKVYNGNHYYEIEMRDIPNMCGRYNDLDINVLKYRNLLGMIPDHFFEYDAATREFSIFCYRGFKAETLERDLLDEIQKKALRLSYVEGENVEKFNQLCDKIRNCEENFSMELETSLLKKGSSKELVSFYGQAMYYNKTTIVRIIGIISSVMRLGKASQMAVFGEDAADKDSATGLFNKRAITEFVKNRIRLHHGSSEDKEKTSFWLAICDIDNFKSVNDTYGHLFGDEVILTFAHALRRWVGNSGMVGRIGGDEFMVMLDVKTVEELRCILKGVRQELEWAFVEKAPAYRFTTSIGVAYFPTDADNYDKLFRTADKTLYIAKEKGRDRFIIYNKELHGEVEDGADNHSVPMITGMSQFAKAEMTADLIQLMSDKGSAAIDKVLATIIDHLNIHGIIIYKRRGSDLYVEWEAGKYEVPVDKVRKGIPEEYYTLFDKNGINRVNNVKACEAVSQHTYEFLTAHKICSTLQFIIGPRDKMAYIISFDVFGAHMRKWSDNDVEMLYLIMRFLGNVLDI